MRDRKIPMQLLTRPTAWAGILLITLGAGCLKHGISTPSGGSDLPPSQVKLTRKVLVAPVEKRDLEYAVHTVGTLEPERQTSIASGVTGVVDEVLFKEGEIVDEDTMLVYIDQAKYMSAVALAAANEQRALARLALAKDFADRSIRLTEQKAGSQEDATKWAQERKAAEAELAAAQAALKMAERDRTKSQVRPPYKGQINQRRVAKGDYVKEETVIATIADIGSLRLTTWIPEMAVAQVRKGDLVDFELAAIPKSKLQAKIFYISTVADPQSHMFECKAEISKEVLEQDPEMKPGLFARVKLRTDQHQNACVIPEESVRASERGFVAFVPERASGKEGEKTWVARARPVQLGFRSPGYVEVLQGVELGERVVTRGSESLEDGTPIEFAEEAPAIEATADAEGRANGKT